MLFVMIGWLIFAFEDSSAGFEYLKIMIGIQGAGFANGVDYYEIFRNAALFVIMFFACLPQPKIAFRKFKEQHPWAGYVSAAVCVIAFVICTAYLVDSSYNPFLYFRF